MATETIAFEQSIDLALASRIGGNGLPDTAIDAAFTVVEKALARLNAEADEGRLPLIAVAGASDDLTAIRAAAARFAGSTVSDIVVLGTGGSSLGAQTLAQLAFHAVPGLGRIDGPRFHFFDNLDPVTFALTLERLPLETTRVLAVSKSGGTGETLIQTIALLSKLHAAGLREKVRDIFIGLSEPRKPGAAHPLRDLLEPEGVTFLDHHTGVGGRYSALTNVGLLPAALLGLDIDAIRAGARDVVASLKRENVRDVPAAAGAAFNVAAHLEGKGIAVLMSYTDRLERFTKWWIQLWAESLGKGGHGSQPVGALGPVDQHSQQQLYLDGPRDKVFTVVTLEVKGSGTLIDAALAERAGQAALAGRQVGDFVAAQGLAMIDTFARNGRPVRRIHLPRLDEYALGALLAHFMIETILAGYALGIDPFDQPAVEEAKLLAKQYLAEGRG
ncbi:MAG: glucose-6-phosphate isomerase [Pseudochelatococcus sp.]|jgi:glucose-6-phosphate isomerase|uniref:glucose-6-phosphate isomerase n=1 Tax=Pseudochelatococcus sp. TaxID=2020869 RepID=UPI003D92251D